MAENYSVNYRINVHAQKAIEAINAFQKVTAKLTTAQEALNTFKTTLNETVASMNRLTGTSRKLDFSTKLAHNKLDNIIKKLATINRMAKESQTLLVTTGATPVGSLNGGGVGAKKNNKVAGINRGKLKASSIPPTNIPNNAAYRTLGPSMMDSGGIGAISMLKGMGLAYGITGLSTLMGSVVRDAAEYNNLMQTTKNILKSHDNDRNFEARFSAMERIIRNVGINTKFTAPQVADASKFLAMAGMDVEDINQAINPIANIALVGDTDLGETADVVTNIMTGYGIRSSEIGHAADIMTQTFTMSNTTLMEIAEAYKYAASLLSAGGISFEESTAALGILGDAGIKGSQAGTSLRTIMANIVNPTKKQAKAWDAAGIERFDKDGNVRDLVDIFTDLSNANLSVDYFYKMFHRTAAQGAVALTHHVDKWNDIIKENLLSEGMTVDLAEAKQNTIKGLWAQLTSRFTEDGMQAFEALDAPIRNFLKEGIAWLDSDEAVNLIKNVSKAFLDVVVMLKDFSMILIDLYKRFEPFIKTWIKWQLYLSSILIPLRAFRALFNFGGMVISAGKEVGVLTLQFSRLFTTLKGLTGLRGALANTWATMAAFGGNGAIGKNIGGYGRHSDEVIKRTLAFNHKKIAMVSGVYGGGFGGIAGSIAGAYLGSSLGEPGNVWGPLVGMAVGGVAGNLIGAKLAPLLTTKVLPFLLTNPLGWATALAGGVAVAVVAWSKYQLAVSDAIKANQEFINKTTVINGIDYSEHASKADKYLQLIYDKRMDANQALSEHIKMLREELGLNTELAKQDDGKTIGEKYAKEIKNLSEPFGFWSTHGDQLKAIFGTDDEYSIIRMNMQHPDKYPKRLKRVKLSGGGYKSGYEFSGVEFWSNESDYLEKLAVAQFAASLGASRENGSPLSEFFNKTDKRLRSVASMEDYNAVLSDISGQLEEMWLKVDTGTTHQTIEAFAQTKNKDIFTNIYAFEAFKKAVKERYFTNTPQGAQSYLAQHFSQIAQLTNLASDTSEEQLDKIIRGILKSAGILAFDEKKFGKFGSPDFLKKMGWNAGKNDWGPIQYKFIDDNGKRVTRELAAEEARKAFLDFHKQIISFVNTLNPKLRKYFESYINNPIWSLGTDSKVTGRAFLDGVEYEQENFSKRWIPKDGNLARGPISDEDMQKALAKQAGQDTDGQAAPGTDTDTSKKTHAGVRLSNGDQSQYKSHYSNQNAAPKQVIVRIENLMNVESVDLANPQKAAVVNSLKRELAYALNDVVADFTEAHHG